MRQPVVDTLRLSDTLRKAGMERDQAEGVARAFGKELGEHVAVQSDLDAGFQGIRSEMALMRTNLEARIDGVRSDLEGVIKELDSKINFGFGLLAALLPAVIGILLGPAGRTGTAMPTPPITINFPATTAFAPTAVPMPAAAPTDSAAARDRDTASGAADADSADLR